MHEAGEPVVNLHSHRNSLNAALKGAPCTIGNERNKHTHTNTLLVKALKPYDIELSKQ